MIADSTAPAVVWFRDDLRLADNPALAAATGSKRPLIALYVMETNAAHRALGGAARWWLHHSLTRLGAALAAAGGRLDVVQGDSVTLVPAIARRLGAAEVHWNRRYGAAERETDMAVKAALGAAGIITRSHNGHLLHEPWEVTTKAGQPMRVFTPFWRAAQARGEPQAPIPAPERVAAADWPHDAPNRIAIAALGLRPTKPDWSGGLSATWTPGEAGARERLDAFLAREWAGYADNRNRPDRPSTSRLSPHLRFGEISVRQVWHAATAAFHAGAPGVGERDLGIFLTELGWREFSYHLLYHAPDLGTRNFQRRFDAFPWRDAPKDLRAWQTGCTGFPIVDAGMRQLWQTGWMHNRVRMIVGSFLTKHLTLDWRLGEAWFWDTLVDADPASNTASWQWVAGTGADAAPYFRVFNPVLQGEKFDPDGAYVRQFVPELAGLAADAIHAPFDAPHPVLARAGITLGRTYPHPIVGLSEGRDRALAAYAAVAGDRAA